MNRIRTRFDRPTGRHFGVLVVLALLLVFGALACAESEPEVEEAELETLPPPATDYETLPADDTAADTMAGPVLVTVTDSSLDMPATVEAGSVTFEVTNEGNGDHGLTIEGNGVSESLAGPVAPGETATLTVDLVPGTYRAYCAAAQDAGVTTEFEVVEGGVDAGMGYGDDAMDEGAMDEGAVDEETTPDDDALI